MLKEEQRKAVLDLLGQKDVAAVLATGFFIFLSRALASLASSLIFFNRTKRKIKQRLCKLWIPFAFIEMDEN